MFGSSQTLTFGAGYSQDTGASQMQTSTPEKKARIEDKQNCLAVTTRVIHDAVAQRVDSSSEIPIHGIEVANVALVGVVEKLVQQGTTLEFTVNDGSGRIKVRHYQTGGMEPSIKAGEYASIVGAIRTLPQLHISALSLRKTQGADEVSYHMIEVVHSALMIRRNQSGSQDLSTPAPKDKMEVDISPPKATEAAVPSSAPVVQAPAAAPAVGAMLKDEAALKDALLQSIRAKGAEEGTHITVLVSEFGSRTAGGEKDIRAALAKLTEDDGELFNPLDEDHFASLQ